MKHITEIARGGEFFYSAPELEVFRIEVEQGFQGTVVSNSWNSALESERSWETTNEAELF